MQSLYYLRHGQSTYNKANRWAGGLSDPPLTKEGREQAEATAENVQAQGIKIDEIISSPLQRALETAKIVARKIGFPEDRISVTDQIKERYYGELEGTVNPIASAKYLLNEASIEKYQNVESMRELQARADAFYESLKQQPEHTILVVGHGAFGRALYRSINSIPIGHRGPFYKNAELVPLIKPGGDISASKE